MKRKKVVKKKDSKSKKKVVRKKPIKKTVVKKKEQVVNEKVVKTDAVKENVVKIINPKTKIKNRDLVRISTGIKNLDAITEKGFKDNSINLVIGGSGSGKSILSMQFLMEGLRKGEHCMYISFEEEKDNFFSNMKKLGWDLYDLEKKGKFSFLNYSPKKVQTMLEEGGGIIESLVLRKKITRIAIDSINSFLLLFEEEVKQREFILMLFNLLRGWNCATILTYEENPMKEHLLSSKILEFEVDSTILLYFLREKSERKRYLEVLKMRGTDHSRKIHPFTIGKNGIDLSRRNFSGKLNL